MRQILYVLIILLFVVCAAFPWSVRAAKTDSSEPTDSQALSQIYAMADEYSRAFFDEYSRRYGAATAAYLVQVRRHDIYAAFIASIKDNYLQKIAREEWVHRESESMIGSGRKFLSSVERMRREEAKREQLRERYYREQQREVGADVEDVQ